MQKPPGVRHDGLTQRRMVGLESPTYVNWQPTSPKGITSSHPSMIPVAQMRRVSSTESSCLVKK
jgi:hypothetical protein